MTHLGPESGVYASANTTTSITRLVGVPICPDLLDHSVLGEADGLRGRVVRGFFWLLRWWKP